MQNIRILDLPSVFTLYSKCFSLVSKCCLEANACLKVAEEYHIVILVVDHGFESFKKTKQSN